MALPGPITVEKGGSELCDWLDLEHVFPWVRVGCEMVEEEGFSPWPPVEERGVRSSGGGNQWGNQEQDRCPCPPLQVLSSIPGSMTGEARAGLRRRKPSPVVLPRSTRREAAPSRASSAAGGFKQLSGLPTQSPAEGLWLKHCISGMALCQLLAEGTEVSAPRGTTKGSRIHLESRVMSCGCCRVCVLTAKP